CSAQKERDERLVMESAGSVRIDRRELAIAVHPCERQASEHPSRKIAFRGGPRTQDELADRTREDEGGLRGRISREGAECFTKRGLGPVQDLVRAGGGHLDH